MYFASQNVPTEWTYSSGKSYMDPFNEVQLDVFVTRPDGSEQRVPAFWAGENRWHVRYSSAQIGTHQLRSVCSDSGNESLHGQAGTLEVTAYTGKIHCTSMVTCG